MGISPAPRAIVRGSSLVIAGVLVALSSACGPAGEAAAPPSASPPAQGQALPAGWRWESFGGVEVGVPGAWGWGNGTQRLTQWCIGKAADKAKPMVGRPGGATLVGCPGADADPDPDTLIANTGTVVAFHRTTEADGLAEQGDRTTVRLDSVEVEVQAPADLRRRIVATIRRAGLDSNGCPTTHALGTKPRWRPGTPAKAESLRDVASVSVCRYQLGTSIESLPGLPPRLLASSRLDGPAAARALGEIAKAPVGGGPNRPDTCMKSYSYGEEAIVLRIRSAAGPTELVIRYSGCDHRGFDDGVAVRRLTAGALAPFIAGPHQQYVPILDR